MNTIQMGQEKKQMVRVEVPQEVRTVFSNVELKVRMEPSDELEGRKEFYADLMDASRSLTEMAEEAVKLHKQGKTRKFPK